jgi:hypothetical protein
MIRDLAKTAMGLLAVSLLAMVALVIGVLLIGRWLGVRGIQLP